MKTVCAKRSTLIPKARFVHEPLPERSMNFLPDDSDQLMVFQLVRVDGSVAWSAVGTRADAARLNRLIARSGVPNSFGYAVVEYMRKEVR